MWALMSAENPAAQPGPERPHVAVPSAMRRLSEREPYNVNTGPLALGVQPYGGPPSYESLASPDPKRWDKETLARLGADILRSGLSYERPTMRIAGDHVRDRLHLLEGQTDVLFSSGGSHDLVERMILSIRRAPYRTRFYSAGVPFNEPEELITVHYSVGGGGKSSTVEHVRIVDEDNVFVPYRALAPMIVETLKSKPRASEDDIHSMFYASEGTPTGEGFTVDQIEEIAEVCDDRNTTFVYDGAFTDARDEADVIRIANLAARYRTFAYITSLSKMVGLPGLRAGYMVTSRAIGERYRGIRKPRDIPGPMKVLYNHIFDPRIIVPHLETVRSRTRHGKALFARELKARGVDFAPTETIYPVLTVLAPKGEIRGTRRNDFYQRLVDIDVQGVAGRDLSALLDNSAVRLTIPSTDAEIRTLASKIGSVYSYSF